MILRDNETAQFFFGVSCRLTTFAALFGRANSPRGYKELVTALRVNVMLFFVAQETDKSCLCTALQQFTVVVARDGKDGKLERLGQLFSVVFFKF